MNVIPEVDIIAVHPKTNHRILGEVKGAGLGAKEPHSPSSSSEVEEDEDPAVAGGEVRGSLHYACIDFLAI